MKTAVLISGQMRTFERCFPNIRFMVLRHFPDADFFVSCVKDEQAKSAQLLERIDPDGVQIEILDQPIIPSPKDDETLRRFAPYYPSAPTQSILRQFWHMEQVWKLFLRTTTTPLDYDCVVRLRPDLFFHRFDVPPLLLENECFTPWWSRHGGCNDRVAVMGIAAAQAYFTTYTDLPTLLAHGAPLHPESLLNFQLQTKGMTIRHTLNAVFTTVRLDGTLVPPDPNRFDLAELALASK